MPENSPQGTDDRVVLVNIMEEIVKLRVRESIVKLGACDCETCYLNACALALNTLKPQYVTTQKGALFVKITDTELANSVNILVAVTKAVMQVKDNPRH